MRVRERRWSSVLLKERCSHLELPPHEHDFVAGMLLPYWVEGGVEDK